MASIKLSLSSSPRTSWVKKAGLGKEALKSALAAAVVAGVLGAGQAQALVVTVNGQQWDVTTFTDSIANASKFQTSANGGMMPWYTGNRNDWALAEQFAIAVNTQLGSQAIDSYALGPAFAFSYCATGTVCTNNINDFGDEGTARSRAINFFDSLAVELKTNDMEFPNLVFAQATLFNGAPNPVPGPLPIFGAAAAFGFSRKLRKRIKANTNAVSSTFSF